MKNLFKKVRLSMIYTSHCLRATSITELDRSGFEARLIMSISGHQSESSIRSYSAHVDDKKKLDMAMSISKAITGDSIHAENNAATLRTGSNSSSAMSPLQDDDIADFHFQAKELNHKLFIFIFLWYKWIVMMLFTNRYGFSWNHRFTGTKASRSIRHTWNKNNKPQPVSGKRKPPCKDSASPHYAYQQQQCQCTLSLLLIKNHQIISVILGVLHCTLTKYEHVPLNTLVN